MPSLPLSLAKIKDVCRNAGVSPADPLTESLDVARKKAIAYQGALSGDLPDIGGVAEHKVHAPLGDVGFRVLYPDHRRSNLPVIVYLHGGGFALNSVDTHERLMRVLALNSGAAVVGIRYTLAPEARFPTQLDQTLDVIKTLRRDGRALGLDGDNLVLAGDSAGANLAIAACLKLKEQGLAQPKWSYLFYGMFSADLDTPSHRAFGGGDYGLTTARVDWFWKQYVADFAQRDNPLAAPLWADLDGIAPQYIVGAGLDCLLDDSLRMHERLVQAGVGTKLTVVEDVPHSFMQMGSFLPEGDAALINAAQHIALVTHKTTILAAE